VARLAEALDFAYARGVAHGDIKPSNVLLTADGVPMLLDFNLAVGWRAPSASDLPDDAGGTLAYMAPERLRAVAGPGPPAAPKAADRHRADIYALGVVLLEALTGRTPEITPGRAYSARQMAALYAESRREGGVSARAPHPAIDPALRSILTRCLAPDPADRYARASELAEDLDLWRTDRPLAFAPEPPWGSRVLRWGRRRKLALAAGLLVAALAAMTAVWGVRQASARERALTNLARYWDHTGSGVFRFTRFDRWRSVGQGDPAEVAHDHLAHFEADGTGDWRRNEDVRDLPAPVRDEVEAWVLEQVLRYGRAVELRPDAPDDWRRALSVVERDAAARPLAPLETQRRRLRRRLGLLDAPQGSARTRQAVDPSYRWMDDYLRGVEAELDGRRSEEELAHYDDALRARPDSFWAHYRAASVAYRLGKYADAVGHLRQCTDLRPNNPALRVQTSACLFWLGRYDDALAACDKAIALDPNEPESYYTRWCIRQRMGQKEGSAADLHRFETLARRQGKDLRGRMRLLLLFARDESAGMVEGDDLVRRLLEIDPDDVDARVMLADRLMRSGEYQKSADELGRVLLLNPDHLWARYTRAILFSTKLKKTDDLGREFSRLVEHPRFEEFLRDVPLAVNAFHFLCWSHLKAGNVPKAQEAAQKGLAYSESLQVLGCESHYALARAYAAAAKTDPSRRPLASEELKAAFRLNPEYVSDYLTRDELMKPFRDELSIPLASKQPKPCGP
jgi:tetratricopeptide (TPR) repeat protein